MAAATYDIKEAVGKNRQQTTRQTEIRKRIDSSRRVVAATESAEFMVTPVGFVFTRCDVILKKAEGETATIHIGTEADDDCMQVSGNVNGAVGATIAKAGTEALKAGTLLSNTGVRVSVPAAANTVNVAIVDVTLVGYVVDL